MPSFSKSSKDKLETCDYRLQKLFNEVIKDWDCTVIEGHRSFERQRALVKEGKSKTMNSRHLSFPSAAIDVMPYPIKWDDELGQKDFANYVYQTAINLGITVHWGGMWKFYDAPHWQVNGEYKENGNDVD